MAAIFASIAPIFLLIFAGNGLRRLPLFEPAFWRGLERMGFYVLYPVLLFTTIVRADFSGLSLGAVMLVLMAAVVVLGLLALALWPLLRRRGLSRPTYSSVFQTSIRWNGFIALAVAEKLFPPEGAAMVALAMAVVIIPINVTTVSVVAWFTNAQPNLGATLRKVATNPLIIGTALAIIVRLLPFPLPGPIMDALHLVGRAALGMGLLAIGAGLKGDVRMLTGWAIVTPTALKLFVFPVLMIGMAMLMGIDGLQLHYLALCAAVPTAMNGYVLAREMGGDAEAYAAVVTVQTAISFLSIPAVLAVTAQLAGT
ncbi:MAG: AEC family transporter [Roseitalea sp.]|jgi:predicted permease|nr:AEC family transporter [Roseitalea sp.]MBO6741325.1 AEC family transporter [Roseitalea sp.]